MPEWLQAADGTTIHLAWDVLLLRLLLAAGFGAGVAAIFALTQRRPVGQTLPLVTTLILLSILVAMTTIVIGDSVARAFGLVGALSIVRFRTVVEDTRDTSFVIFAVVVGMAMGAGNALVCLVGVPIVGVVAVAMSKMGTLSGRGIERRLEVRVGAGRDPDAMLAAAFDQLLSWRLVSVVSARQGTATDVIYRVKLRDPAALLALVKSVQAIEGVQSVELKED